MASIGDKMDMADGQGTESHAWMRCKRRRGRAGAAEVGLRTEFICCPLTFVCRPYHFGVAEAHPRSGGTRGGAADGRQENGSAPDETKDGRYMWLPTPESGEDDSVSSRSTSSISAPPPCLFVSFVWRLCERSEVEFSRPISTRESQAHCPPVSHALATQSGGRESASVSMHVPRSGFYQGRLGGERSWEKIDMGDDRRTEAAAGMLVKARAWAVCALRELWRR
ncbi:hypothetical protein R3P38DRAFT_2802272 [Favolaschia claudopus]|uniref:Uncharacterized protein n=1 Tax=Favolaschia claudopus TaxID=2862362 RepID=A0AAV9ZUM2_9AGAR